MKYVLGSVIDVNSGEWLGQLSGLGAGIDSFFEYLLKVDRTFSLFTNSRSFSIRIIYYSAKNLTYACLMMRIAVLLNIFVEGLLTYLESFLLIFLFFK